MCPQLQISVTEKIFKLKSNTRYLNLVKEKNTRIIVNLKNTTLHALQTLTAITKDNEGNVFGLNKIVGRYLFSVSVTFTNEFFSLLLCFGTRVQNINFTYTTSILRPTKWNVSRDQPFRDDNRTLDAI